MFMHNVYNIFVIHLRSTGSICRIPILL